MKKEEELKKQINHHLFDCDKTLEECMAEYGIDKGQAISTIAENKDWIKQVTDSVKMTLSTRQMSIVLTALHYVPTKSRQFWSVGFGKGKTR